MKDPIIQEVREARDQYAKKFGYDLIKIAQDIRKKQKNSKRRILKPPKRIKSAA